MIPFIPPVTKFLIGGLVLMTMLIGNLSAGKEILPSPADLFNEVDIKITSEEILESAVDEVLGDINSYYEEPHREWEPDEQPRIVGGWHDIDSAIDYVIDKHLERIVDNFIPDEKQNDYLSGNEADELRVKLRAKVSESDVLDIVEERLN